MMCFEQMRWAPLGIALLASGCTFWVGADEQVEWASLYGSDTAVTCDQELSEIGDTDIDISLIGKILPPNTICGDIYEANNDGDAYLADVDLFKFSVPKSGDHRLSLSWEADDADYDLLLIDASGNNDILNGSIQDINIFEELIYDLSADTDYYVEVGGWAGNAGVWFVEIEREE